jgi:hypothetical protein
VDRPDYDLSTRQLFPISEAPPKFGEIATYLLKKLTPHLMNLCNYGISVKRLNQHRRTPRA